MNPKVILGIQLLLMGLFFYLIFGVFDAKQTSGLIGIGASMAIIFGIVLFLEKIKEKMNQPVNTETPIEQTSQPITPPVQQSQVNTQPPQSAPTTNPPQPSQNQTSSTQVK